VGGWREETHADIASISPAWARRYGWDLRTDESDDHIDLFVRLSGGDHTLLLRLRYQEDFQSAGRREEFCDPDDPSRCGPEYWPRNTRGFTSTDGRRCICLAGTWGFHRLLHPERDDAAQTTVGRLLIEIQQLLNGR